MQTFLPFPSFSNSALVLDNKRLGKQRVETKQILQILLGESQAWKHHPAVLMWKGYERSLIYYGLEVCLEWKNRGFNDSLYEYFQSKLLVTKFGTLRPWWVGNSNFHQAHQSNLLRKDFEFYSKQFSLTDFSLPYIWPVRIDKKTKEVLIYNFELQIYSKRK